MFKLSKSALLATGVLVVAASLASGFAGVKIGRQYEHNRLCCQTPPRRNIRLAIMETLGLIKFPSQIGQDKWVLEKVFPDVTNGFFLDVGSADGTFYSNSKALEKHGWTGICIDPFPRNMQDRTCQMLREVVFSEAGRKMEFHASGDIGGLSDTLGVLKSDAQKGPTVELTTTTLGEILKRTKAPTFIHFVSLDIEGAELEALKGFPFDKYKIGTLAVEHNNEEPKRTDIEALMKSHGYRRAHSWYQDDFYLPARSR